MDPIGVRPPAPAPSASTAPESVGRDTAAALWASQLLGALLPGARAVGLPPPSEARGGANSARPAAPQLSPSGVEGPSQPSDTDGVKPLVPDRMTVEVQTAELGSLQVTIERHSAGISLLIAGDANAKVALLADRQALVDALTHGSGPVTSVRILRRDEVGTVLAEGVPNRKERSGDAKANPFSPPSASKTPSKRRLNLVG